MFDRRILLKAGGLALFSAGVGPAFLGRTALAAEPGPRGRRKTLVALFQRGAMDGLAAVPPLDEARLGALRPRLAMSAARAAGDGALLDLGVGFGLHPALADLLPPWRDGNLAIVHAVGSPDPTRSHFDAQDYMETGTPGRKGTPDGWLNRVSGLLGHDATPFRSVATTPMLPRSLYGREPALAVPDLGSFHLPPAGAARPSPTAERELAALYEGSSEELLRGTAQETFEAVERLRRLRPSRYRPAAGARYPESPLGRGLKQIAFLIKSDVGLEVAFVESSGWDTHVQQGTTGGSFARAARDLGLSAAAFWRDLGPYRQDVVLLTMTEFGRTVRENGSGGTDHGHGSCLFVLGDKVAGGRVHGRFPGLAPDALYQGRDLPVTTDFRSVFAGLARDHFAIADGGSIFPGWNGQPLHLLGRG